MLKKSKRNPVKLSQKQVKIVTKKEVNPLINKELNLKLEEEDMKLIYKNAGIC